jgi:hypothetical protein
MKLSNAQIKDLHYHINGKQIPYIEVRDEILDHYQTALEMEKSGDMDCLLEELDTIFTYEYCQKISKNYLESLKTQYPKLYKQQLIELFSTRQIWIPLTALAFTLSLPLWIQNGHMLMHFLNMIVLGNLALENWKVTRKYTKGKQKHQYRSFDDKPTFALHQAGVLKGYAVLPGIFAVLVMIPVILIGLSEFAVDDEPRFFFQLPYLYFTLAGIWCLWMGVITREKTKSALIKSKAISK